MKKIKLSRTKAWGEVPEALVEDPTLSHAARLLGVWLAIRPDGWKVNKSQVKKVLGMGEKNWDKACRELTNAGYLSSEQVRKEGAFNGLDFSFNPEPKPQKTTSTGGARSAPSDSAPAATVPAGSAQLTRPPETKTSKHKQQQRGGGVFESHVVKDNTQSQPQAEPVAMPTTLSEVMGIAGPQAQQLDQLAHGASVEQLERLKAAHAVGMANGIIKNPGGWLAMMAKKAAVGGITELKARVDGSGAASVIDQLKAHSVPIGTVITVADKRLTVGHVDGVPRVMYDGLWIGVQRSLKVLLRVRAGELPTSSGGAA